MSTDDTRLQDLFGNDPPGQTSSETSPGQGPGEPTEALPPKGDLATVMPDPTAGNPGSLADDADTPPNPESGPRELYRIRSAEVDPRGRATPTAIANLLQEAATSDARRRGFGVEQLRSQGLTWYLSRLFLRLRRAPWIGETVEIETWPAGFSSIHALRDFRLFLDSGPDAVEVGIATSGWLLIDRQSGKAKRRPAEALAAQHAIDPRRAIEMEFGRLPDMSEMTASSPSNPSTPTAVERPYPLRRTDVDLNGHVSYGVFVDALMEAVPTAFWATGDLLDLEIDFRAEARSGDELVTAAVVVDPPAAADSPPSTAALPPGEPIHHLIHAVTRASDGRALVRARSRWTAPQGDRASTSDDSGTA